MSATVETPPSGRPHPNSRARSIVANVALTAVVGVAWLRGVGRDRRRRRDRDRRFLAPEEVIVVYPSELWRDWRAGALEDALKLVTGRMRRWRVAERERRAVERKHLRTLSRTYIRFMTTQGVEDDVVRAINLAAWRYGLPRGRRGVLAVRSPLIAPASTSNTPGPIEMLPAYHEAKARIGVADRSASGIKILIVDFDRPALTHVPDADVTILDPSQDEIRSGHATLMTAIVADIAKGAIITTCSIGDERDKSSFFALLAVLLREHDADVIVASLSAPEGGSTKDGQGRDDSFELALRQRLPFPKHPPILFPTGNLSGDPTRQPPIYTMAIPARFDSVIAIGACHEMGRMPDSRYGSKMAGDPSAWWLAPGSSLKGPLLRMGGKDEQGTSIANAIAGAMAAIALYEARKRQPKTGDEFANASESMKNSLRTQANADASVAIAETYEAVHTDGALTLDRLKAQLDQLAHELVPPDPREHGHGLLSLEPAESRVAAKPARSTVRRLIPPAA
jgi:Subtilase family